jgi:hypothetical protein
VLLGAAGPVELCERDRAASDNGRRGYHAGLPLVSIRIIQKVISTSRLLVQPDRNQISARRGVIISAASGTAKTTALTSWAAPTNGQLATVMRLIGTGCRCITSWCRRTSSSSVTSITAGPQSPNK